MSMVFAHARRPHVHHSTSSSRWNVSIFADRLRKAIAKKVGQDFDVCEARIFINAKEKNIPYNFVHYIWNVLFKIQRGYSFNLSHTLAYSMIGTRT